MSVSSVSSSYSNSLQGYGGLASGLDRDSLIEGMTLATRTKIESKEQEKQALEWEQSALQDLISKVYSFTDKFTSFTSSSNILSSNLFLGNRVSSLGANSDKISATANNVSGSPMSILGVKSMARDETAISDSVSNKVLQTGELAGFDSNIDTNLVEGSTMRIKYGETTYTITLDGDHDYSTAEGVAAGINEALSEVSVAAAEDGTLASALTVGVSGGALTFTGDGNHVEIVSGSGDTLKNLGLEGKELTIGTTALVADAPTLTETKTVAETMEGQSLTFTYNGKSETITLGSYADATAMAEDIQKQLNSAFGNGRIEVSYEENRLSFQTTIPGASAGSNTDNSSTLVISGSSDLVSEDGIFGIAAGTSNRVNTTASIADSGLKNAAAATGDMIISNNGVEVNLADHGLTWDSSVSEIMNTINGIEELEIEISYQSETDKFSITSTQKGASGEISLGGSVSEALFGGAAGLTVQEGQDAVIRVQYEGSDEAIEIVRDSNSFTVDGLTVGVKGEFGYDASGNYIEGTEAITFETTVDIENTTEIVKDMIEEYNSIIDELASAVNTRYDRDYQPLTDAQKEEMSESEIENWEEKAKEGLLYNDTDVRNMLDDLRFILPSNMYQAFEEIGITVSSNYQDNGKLIFDENKFTEAMETDSENVRELLSTGTDGSSGLVNSMKDIMDRYAQTTGADKGIFVDRAGSSLAPSTVLTNSMQQELDDLDDYIKNLNDLLQTEEDRYIQEFTALETLISNMNTQSSYLSSMFA